MGSGRVGVMGSRVGGGWVRGSQVKGVGVVGVKGWGWWNKGMEMHGVKGWGGRGKGVVE